MTHPAAPTPPPPPPPPPNAECVALAVKSVRNTAKKAHSRGLVVDGGIAGFERGGAGQMNQDSWRTC